MRSFPAQCRTYALVAASILVSSFPVASFAEEIREIIREPTPLVLKDGRIAHVKVYSVPFKEGAADLDGPARTELANLIETIATDCFLTAQAIGHVEPSAAKGGESLTAHRLARARADRVQSTMVARGFSASSIASVWDWQFLVGEPRVTLWVFRLNQGEDCQGEPLPRPDGKPQVAAAEKEPKGTGQSAKAEARAEAEPLTAATDSVTKPPAMPRPPAATPPAAVAPPAPVAAASAAPATDARSAKPAKTLPAPASKETVVADLDASTPPPAPAVAPKPARAQMAAVAPTAAADDAAAIVFDNNSSFFSKDARDALKQFVAELPRDRPVAVEVVTAVGGADVREAANTDPLRYNRWMAERRSGRVVEFLRENAGGRKLDFHPVYQENDSSRTVVLRRRPLP